jgi:hydroxymethylbilane synthase
MIPAVGQGIIAVQCKKESSEIINLLKKIDHPPTRLCAVAERSLLKTIGGDCDTAVGGLAIIENNSLILHAQLFSDDGKEVFNFKSSSQQDQSESLGKTVGLEILKKAGNHFKKN